MPTIVVRHRVGNFNTWLKGHPDRVDLFSKFATGFQTFQDVNDPNSVVMVADVFDMPGMQSLMSNSEVMKKVAIEKHMVIEPITISMPVNV